MLLYAIKYLQQTVEYGIAFHSYAATCASAFVHFPFHHDIEACNDALRAVLIGVVSTPHQE